MENMVKYVKITQNIDKSSIQLRQLGMEMKGEKCNKNRQGRILEDLLKTNILINIPINDGLTNTHDKRKITAQVM
jgi:hypothetical protein